jgi:DNA-binding LacI/PurR family transcriptional regulator
VETSSEATRRPGRGRRSRATTMRDIADATGLSQSTVSRVLSGAPSPVTIGEQTRSRVVEVARQFGYRPNPLARGLRGARTMLLGVIVREITDPFFVGAVEAISSEATARGYNLVLGHAHSKADEAIALRAVLETRHCDALLLLGDMRDQPRLLDDLRNAHIPLVALWQGSPLEAIPTVNVDNRWGVEAQLDHLVALGHRRIGFIAGRQLGDIRERRTAFLEGVGQLGAGWSHVSIEDVPNDPDGGADALDVLMDLSQPPTAVVTTTDTLAIGVLHAAHRRGLRVPDDVSVVGFDDIPLARFTVPALTTVHMPTAEMAAVAVRAAIDESAGSDGERPVAHVLRPWLVVRGSTAPAPGMPPAGGAAR